MTKFLKLIFSFILFAAVGYCVILTIIGMVVPDKYLPNLKYRQGATGFTHSRLKEVKNVEDVDILFLGSSHAYRGFDTRIYQKEGYKVFNLGSSTQTPMQTKILLQRYLDKLRPKRVVYEVYPLIFCSDGVESALDIISNDKNDKHSLEMAMELDHLLIYNSLLYSGIREFVGLNSSFEEKNWKVISQYVSGGYVDRQLRYFKYVEYPKDHWEFNADQFEYFEEIVQLLKEEGIEIKLVYAPITRTKYDSYDNHDEFDEIMEGYAQYFNLNKTLTLDDSLHFYDSNHLNQEGVKIFNSAVLELLEN